MQPAQARTESDQAEEARVVVWDGTRDEVQGQALIGEEPLRIEVEGRPYAVIMRTPGEELAHAAGFCLAEGLVDRPADFSAIEYCQESDSNVVSVTLEPKRRAQVGRLLERRAFLSQSSCGICGKQLIKDLEQIVSPLTDDSTITLAEVLTCVRRLSARQGLYRTTHSSHAALLFDRRLEPLALAEDIGRHNALDKAVGQAFLARRLEEARIGVLSSRISYELVQKAGRARLPILVSLSRPSALAVELGRGLNLSLACRAGAAGLFIYCGRRRFQP